MMILGLWCFCVGTDSTGLQGFFGTGFAATRSNSMTVQWCMRKGCFMFFYDSSLLGCGLPSATVIVFLVSSSLSKG